MTQSSLPNFVPNPDANSVPRPPEPAKPHAGNTVDVIRALTPMFAEVIRASTPLFIALIGGVIGISVLVAQTSDKAAGFGVASAAIAGAAGLAQPNKEPKEPKDQ